MTGCTLIVWGTVGNSKGGVVGEGVTGKWGQQIWYEVDDYGGLNHARMRIACNKLEISSHN